MFPLRLRRNELEVSFPKMLVHMMLIVSSIPSTRCLYSKAMACAGCRTPELTAYPLNAGLHVCICSQIPAPLTYALQVLEELEKGTSKPLKLQLELAQAAAATAAVGSDDADSSTGGGKRQKVQKVYVLKRCGGAGSAARTSHIVSEFCALAIYAAAGLAVPRAALYTIKVRRICQHICLACQPAKSPHSCSLHLPSLSPGLKLACILEYLLHHRWACIVPTLLPYPLHCGSALCQPHSALLLRNDSSTH